MLIGACAGRQETVLIKAKPSEQLLECREFVFPEKEPKTEKEFAPIFVDLYFSWKDCWQKLKAVKEFSNHSVSNR